AMRPAAAEATTDAALSDVLGKALLSLRDRHVSLSMGAGRPTIAFSTPSDAGQPPFDLALVARSLTRGFESMQSHVSYGRVSPGVGYVLIQTFAGADW